MSGLFGWKYDSANKIQRTNGAQRWTFSNCYRIPKTAHTQKSHYEIARKTPADYPYRYAHAFIFDHLCRAPPQPYANRTASDGRDRNIAFARCIGISNSYTSSNIINLHLIGRIVLHCIASLSLRMRVVTTLCVHCVGRERNDCACPCGACLFAFVRTNRRHERYSDSHPAECILRVCVCSN